MPSPKPNTPFRRADYAQFGLTRHAIDTDRFQRPFPGVRVQKPLVSDEPHPYARAHVNAQHYAPLLKPGDMFSHTTALRLYGCPIRVADTVHVSVSYGRGSLALDGVRRHRYRNRPAMRTAQGLPVVDPVTALVQSAAQLSLVELVIAIDHLICPRFPHRLPIISVADLQKGVASSSRAGVRRVRDACELSRAGAESRYETILRLELSERGFTDLELQVELHDDSGFVGRFDLLSRTDRSVFEYDGEQHRTDREQYLTDIERLDRVRHLGWRVLRFHFEDVTRETWRIDEKLRRFGL